jgi:hypothetical protein
MSDIAALRELAERASSIAHKLSGNLGIVSMRLPTQHEIKLAYADAAFQSPGDSLGVQLRFKRALCAKAIKAWSISPRMLVESASGEDADDVLPVSAAAAELFFDQYPQEFAALSDALFEELAKRAKAQEAAEKN